VNIFTHKEYTGAVEIDPKAGILFGRVLDLDAVLTFEGETVREAEQAFRDTVEDYLDWCAERGVEPEKPLSGSLYLHTTPEQHRKIALAAAASGKSIAAWADDTLATAADCLLHTDTHSAAGGEP